MLSLGVGLPVWTAKLGCDSGLSSAGLMYATYGSSFARLPALLHAVQLVGCTTFELVVMRDGWQVYSIADGVSARWTIVVRGMMSSSAPRHRDQEWRSDPQ